MRGRGVRRRALFPVRWLAHQIFATQSTSVQFYQQLRTCGLSPRLAFSSMVATYEQTALQRLRGYEAINGWLIPEEAATLYLTACKVPSGGQIVEIGSWQGKSTICLATGLVAPDTHIHAIDPFIIDSTDGKSVYSGKVDGEERLAVFKRNLDKWQVGSKVTPYIGYSRDFVGRFPRIDLLFIDGDHSIAGCQFDVDAYLPYIVSGGYLLLHDYRPQRADLGPTYVINHQLRSDPNLIFLGLFGSIWVARKK